MTNERIEELAIEETEKAFPTLESNNQSYFWGIVNSIKNTIINDYDINSIESEQTVRKLMQLDIENLKKTLK
ncbi:hypothetical protein [Ureibacillus acetophenoni]|uniref:Uncharacterized protein n=1 Tax=Ureibacillus acetophenoni TaxID=614649 RepID=A0A285UUT7_9BACL|nr:hypothetical protein [Ureibacillus acetophenoni]SOC44476.1 hypothetical protein SAMN05877842_12043 [Ureibacillus acetophenoni]